MSTDDPLAPFIAALHAGRLRVWSIVVTIFGDCIQPRGGRAAMAELQAIAERMGIEGGALRTAMSRLARDGWVERTREGRNSFYTLSERGRAVFTPATRQIYRARFADADAPWLIAISQNGGPDPDGPSLSLGRQVTLIAPEDAAGCRAAGDLVLSATPAEVPAWVCDAAFDADLAGGYRSLADLIATVRPEDASALPPLDALALRVMLIHAWRRLTLRHPVPPAGLVAADWPGEACHTALARLYPALVETSETWWPTATPDDGQQTLATRFTS
ncbi:MAG: PaaX family transcriptional regulator C-terminal domain-containing protein [Pseudomonadota bacterium]